MPIYRQHAGTVGALGGATLANIPDGPDGVRETLKVMAAIAKQYRRDPAIRLLAESIVRNAGVQERDYRGEVAALHAYVRDSIRYTLDVNDVETLKAPPVTLETGMGDCDDKSLLLATLLESMGHPARFVAVGFAPDCFEHVLVETRIGGPRDWIALEATEAVEAGWYPDDVQARMVRHI